MGTHVQQAAEVHEDRLGGYFLVTATPLRDESGKVIGSVHVARDITEQKKDMEVLRHLLETSDHERNLISCEIHDDLAQQLAGAVMQFEECLNNACHHSKSKKVKVKLTQHDGQLQIEVRDWGVGFRIDRIDAGHFGLKGIQQRAKVFGGHATIKSSLRKGTDVIVELPLHPISR